MARALLLEILRPQDIDSGDALEMLYIAGQDRNTGTACGGGEKDVLIAHQRALLFQFCVDFSGLFGRKSVEIDHRYDGKQLLDLAQPLLARDTGEYFKNRYGGDQRLVIHQQACQQVGAWLSAGKEIDNHVRIHENHVFIFR